MSTGYFHEFLQSGKIKGYFTYEQFWHYWSHLHEHYPEYITDRFVVGKTFFDDDMHGFYMGTDMHKDKADFSNKNIVFITALHHSREPLTVTMVLYMMIEILKEMGVCGDNTGAKEHWKRFFETNVIYFIPIVNIDSYKFIASNWKGDHGQEVLMIRKNRNINHEKCNVYTGGVDLNRNYSFMFGLNDTGSSSNPCEEDYRGTAAFSEPETRAIRDFVDSHPTIVTAINMHTYGNAWVYPFNFVHDKRNMLMKKQKPKFYNFYNEFVNDMKHQRLKADYGNAQATVQYPTNGEAGDWITEVYNVINLDVELGNLDKRSNQFYPPASIIPQICEYNFQVFRNFFFRHNVDLRLHQVTRNPAKNTYTFIIFNKSISSLIDFKAKVTPKFLNKNRKLVKKELPLELQPWHVIDFKALSHKKKKKQNRKLADEPHWKLNYKVSAECNNKTSDLERAEHGEFHATLLGRNFLVIQFTFKEGHSMHTLEGIDLKLDYGHDVSREYYFDSYSSQIKATNQRMLKDVPGEIKRKSKPQEKAEIMPVLLV
jgi:hypothetical protein